jgi:hypothetical protein
MVLSWIAEQGCPIVGKEFAAPPKYEFFCGSQPSFRGDEGFTMYIPQEYDYGAVDAILVSINRRTKEAVVVGVQVKISKKHTKSEEPFLRHQIAYEDQLGRWCESFTYRFLWICEKLDGESVGGSGKVDAVGRNLRVGGRSETPSYERLRTTVWALSPQIGEQLQAASKAK